MNNVVVQLAPITAEVRERIVQAADTLFAQADYQTLPTVDQVRRVARADMNATSAVMRDWRREQAARAAPAPVQLPDTLAQAHTQAVAALWAHAQQLANDSLLAAQAGWDAERAEIGAIQQQVSSAYDALSTQFEQVKGQAATELAAMRAELANALARAERAEARLGEVERRCNTLMAKNERLVADITQVQAQADQATRDLAKAQEAALQAAERHSEQRKQTAAEVHRAVERMTRAETNRDESQREATKARESAAKLHGQVEALREQFAALLRTLGQGGDGSGA